MDKITIQKEMKIPGTRIVLEKGDKIYLKGSNVENLNEAFAAGTARKVIEKMINILKKRLGCEISICYLPIELTTSEGKYNIFCGSTLGSKRKMFSINFKLGTSDVIDSFFFYNGDYNHPVKKLDLNGFNIVQVLADITLAFKGELEDALAEKADSFRDNKKQEAIGVYDVTKKFLDANAAIVAQFKADPKKFDADKVLPIYLDFAKENGYNRKCNAVSMKANIAYIFNHYPQYKVDPQNVPLATITTAPKVVASVVVASALSAADQKIWDSITVDRKAKDTWLSFERHVRLLARGVKGANALIACGTPGTGKTYSVEKILNEEGIDYQILNSNIKETSDIIASIYVAQQEGKQVIVFDDMDAILSSSNRSNMFKQLFDNQRNPRQTGMNSKMRTVDSNGNQIEVPPIFSTKMRFIMLSNKDEDYFEEAIKDRVFFFPLVFTKKELVDLIKEKLPVLGQEYWAAGDPMAVTDQEKAWLFDLVTVRYIDMPIRLSLRSFVKGMQTIYYSHICQLSKDEITREVLKVFLVKDDNVR